MSKYGGWHPLSHDLNADPEVWELTERFGDRSLRIWIEVLSIADRNEGVVGQETEYLFSTLSHRSHTSLKKVKQVLDYAKSKMWLLSGESLRVRNHAKYHRTRVPNSQVSSRKLDVYPPDQTLLTRPDQTRPDQTPKKVLSLSGGKEGAKDASQEGEKLVGREQWQSLLNGIGHSLPLTDSSDPDLRRKLLLEQALTLLSTKGGD